MLKQRIFLAMLLLGFVLSQAMAQIQVSENNKFLQTRDGKPFFWLGDTDWALFQRLTREEAERFLEVRKQQGFNVIHAVALAEFGGLHEPNRYGDIPLTQDDPTRMATTPGSNPLVPEEYDYWDHVDFIINKAAEKGLYIGLLPTWGDKVAHLREEGPVIFNEQNAEIYAVALAKRYAKQWNIIWILGGDHPAVYTSQDGTGKAYDDRPVWRAMAKGIESVLGKEAFITYHPWGGENSTTQYVHNESWLDMNSFQSGHGSRDADAWNWVKRDLAFKPQKPTLDMEPCYEDHPVNPWDGKWTRKERGYFTAYDVRARIYRGVFAGACGVTYGHHHIWQFINPDLYKPLSTGDTVIVWSKAMYAEAAGEMQYVKNLMLSRPYFSRIEDQTLIKSNPGTTYINLLYATRDENSSYAMIYLPENLPVKVDLSKISGISKSIWWYDPRTGKSVGAETVKGNDIKQFTPPKNGKDWILVIDDASKKFKPPGVL